MTPLTWQRMDTAPKDGTWVLAYDPTIPEPRHLYNIVRRHNDRWENCHGYYVTHATHWMPLPSPPMERTPGEDSAEILASERRTSDRPRDTAWSSSSLRAMWLSMLLGKPQSVDAVDPAGDDAVETSTRDTAWSSSSLRAMYVEEAEHLAAIDLTDQIQHLRQQGGQ